MSRILRPAFLTLALASMAMASGATSPLIDSTATPVLIALPGSNRVILRWSLCPSCDSYEVFRSAASSGPWTSIARLRGTTVHADTGLVSRTLYFYRVSGFRGTIEGDYSDVLQAITLDSLADSLAVKRAPSHP